MWKSFLGALADSVQYAIHPFLGSRLGREWSGIAHSGDTTFKLDAFAEDAIHRFMRDHPVPVAVYTEDAGLVKYNDAPQAVVIIDPIDGTRPATAGFPTCLLSFAVADWSPTPVFGDLTEGYLVDPFTGVTFYGSKGHGVEIQDPQKRLHIHPTDTADPRKAFIGFEVAGRPLACLLPYLDPLLRTCSLTAGAFCFNSSAFALSRILTGQLDAFADFGGRALRDMPGAKEAFLEAGSGHIVGLFPYDIAAAYVLLKEAGCTITDGWGRDLDPMPLMDLPKDTVLSCLAASNAVLHGEFLNLVS